MWLMILHSRRWNSVEQAPYDVGAWAEPDVWTAFLSGP